MRRLAVSQIRPKISTMPRQKSEAAAFLDIYKVTVEKKRLQQEIQTIDQRRVTICQRIAALDSQLEALEQTVQQMRNDSSEESRSLFATDTDSDSPTTTGFSTFTLDY